MSTLPALLSKGFQLDDTHHHMYWLYVTGKKTGIYTKISHGERELKETLIHAVARQMWLTKKQLLAFVKCSIDADDYVRILTTDGPL